MTFGAGAGVGAGVGANVGASIPNPLAILNGGAGVGASLPGLGAGLSLGGGGGGGAGAGAGAGVNVGGGGQSGWGASGQQGAGARAGLGVGLGGGGSGQVGAGVGANGGAGLGVGGNVGAGGGDQGQGQGGWGANGGQNGETNGGQGAGVGAGIGINGGGGGSASGEAGQGGAAGGSVGAGLGANGGAAGGSSASPTGNTGYGAAGGSSAGVGGNAGVGGSAPAASAGLGVNGNSGAGNSGAGVGAGIGAGIGAGVGGGINVGLSPLPGVQAGGAGGGSGSPCTVVGSQARLLYFPPGGNGQVASSSVEAQPPGATITTAPGAPSAQGQPVPAGGTPLTAWSNTFNPNYCYLSVDTLYATVAPSGTESASTVGPTFSNAIIPLQSSDISTRCPSTMSGAAAGGAPGQLDFSSIAAAANGMADSCHEIAAPAAMGTIVPEWNNGLWWQMNFEPPQVLRPEGEAASSTTPAGGECTACAAPAYSPAANTPYPTMVPAPGYQGVASGPTTASAGVTPSSAGQYTRTPATSATGGEGAVPGVPSAGFTTGIAPNGTSTAGPTAGGPSPSQYTGGALNIKGGRGLSMLVAGLLLTLAFL